MEEIKERGVSECKQVLVVIIAEGLGVELKEEMFYNPERIMKKAKKAKMTKQQISASESHREMPPLPTEPIKEQHIDTTYIKGTLQGEYLAMRRNQQKRYD